MRGFTHIEKPELLAALHDPTTRQQIEGYVAELLQSPPREIVGVSASPAQDATLIKSPQLEPECARVAAKPEGIGKVGSILSKSSK